MFSSKDLDCPCRMGRGVVQDNEPEMIRVDVNYQLKILQKLGYPFAMVGRIQPFTRREVQTAEERVLGILQTRRVDLDLLTNRCRGTNAGRCCQRRRVKPV